MGALRGPAMKTMNRYTNKDIEDMVAEVEVIRSRRPNSVPLEMPARLDWESERSFRNRQITTLRLWVLHEHFRNEREFREVVARHHAGQA